MREQTKGKCKYCGKEYTKGYMTRHLTSCKERKARIAAETGTKKYGYYELVISGTFYNSYWLIIEIREDVTLKVLDSFLRDIWLECCGHLSAFQIDGVLYDAIPPDTKSFWGPPVKSMNCKLKAVLQKGMTFTYEYDFGSSTDLTIKVQDYRVSYWKKDKLTILSRNNPPELLCDICHEKPAAFVNAVNMQLLCEDCGIPESEEMEAIEEIEEMLLPVCNSPRMGVCAYEGSTVYPDQFVPDTEKDR